MKIRSLAVMLLAALTTVPAFGQGVAFFQDGVTMLPGGGVYDSTIDTEFRAADPTEPQGENQEMSIDQFDGGFQTQAAIRFENLLVSQGGLVPNGLASGQILFAEFRLWKTSASDSDANIDFNRIVGTDTTSGDYWQVDDTWASLGGDLIPDEFGLLDGDPIKRDNIEAAMTPDFQESPSRFGPEDTVVLNPNEAPVPMSTVYTTDVDSDEIFGSAWDGTPEDLLRAVDLAFYRFEVTDAVRDWLTGGMPNYGWSISNDTGNGWDMTTSDLLEAPNSDFAGLDPFMFRPSLTIIFDDGSAGPLDIDKDSDVDLDDFEDFLDLLGSELDGPLATGAPGDFDFNRVVDLNDFKYFKENYPGGPGALAAALAGVPEPSSCLMAVGCLLGFVMQRRLNG